MSVVAEDLLQPKGPVTNLMFPGVPSNLLAVNLTAYIVRASEDTRILTEPDSTKTDRLIKYLALHFVFQDSYIEMNSRPLTVTQTEKGSHGFSTEQIRNMRALSEQWFGEFLSLLTPSTASTKRGITRSVRNVFGW